MAWPHRTTHGSCARVNLVVVDSPEEAAIEAVDADAVMGWLTQEILDNGTDLRWVQLTSAGVERFLAIPGLESSSVVLTNAQRIYAVGGAEHVLAMTFDVESPPSYGPLRCNNNSDGMLPL